MADAKWHEEFEVICSTIPLEQCDRECWGECAARRRMLDELGQDPVQQMEAAE